MQEGIINGVQFDFNLKNNDKKENNTNVNNQNNSSNSTDKSKKPS